MSRTLQRGPCQSFQAVNPNGDPRARGRIMPALLGLALMLVAGSPKAEYWVYSARPGDNLWNLCEEYLTRVTYWPQIQELNSIPNPRRILPGTRIKFPIKWLRVQPVPATVVRVQGEVQWARGGEGEPQPLSAGTVLRVGDRVATGGDGIATLEFADGSRLLVQAGSEIILDTMSAYGRTGMVDTRLRLQKGRTESETRPSQGPASRYRITTPAAVAAVRGTSFRVGAGSQGEVAYAEVEHGRLGVRAKGVTRLVREGFGVVTSAGKAPPKPRKLLAPPDLSGAAVLHERPLVAFQWPAIESADEYRVQVYADAALNALVRDKLVAKPAVQLSGLDDGDYVMRVRAVAADGLEGRNGMHSFTLDAQPYPPALLKPADGAAMVQGTHPEFWWSVPEGVEHFRLQLARDPAFSDIVTELNEFTGSRHTADVELAPGDYHWRLASTDASGEKGPFGDAWRFRIQVVPPKPEAQPPDVGKERVRMSWHPVADAVKYEFQLARDSEFKDLVIESEIAQTSVTIPNPSPGTYYFRARGVSDELVPGPYSTANRVEVPYENVWQFLAPLLILVPLLL